MMTKVGDARSGTKPPAMSGPVNPKNMKGVMGMVSQYKLKARSHTKIMELAPKHPHIMQMKTRRGLLFRQAINNPQGSSNFVFMMMVMMPFMIILCLSQMYSTKEKYKKVYNSNNSQSKGFYSNNNANL